MRAFMVIALFAFAYAKPQTYNYLHQQQLQHQQAQFSLGPRPDQIALPAHVTAAPLLAQQTRTNAAVQPTNGAFTGVETEDANKKYLPPVETFVSKHFYFHSGPEDDLQQDEAFQPGPHRKHYRVLFIKAPTSGNLAELVKTATPQDEEKTVIYVLNKKTDVTDLKHALDSKPQTPVKPEVFFIKYKTPEEAIHAQHEIQAQYDALGGTSEVSDEGYAPVQSFIGSVPSTESPVHHNQYLPPNF